MRLGILGLGFWLFAVGSPGVARAQSVTPEGSRHHVGSEAEYRSALGSLSSGDVEGSITFDADIVLEDGTDPIYSGTQALTIDGNGFSLSGNDQSRVLAATEAAKPMLTIRDITVSHGASGGSGGAVEWPGPVTVLDSTFEDNAVSGPDEPSGGAIFAEGSVTVDSSIFTDNVVVATTGLGHGGAISALGAGASVTITRSVFADNTVTASAYQAVGGAVRALGAVDVVDSAFLRNEATGQDAFGGAIGAESVTLRHATLIENAAHGGGRNVLGGAVFGGGHVTVEDSTLRANVADLGWLDIGSAVATYGIVELRDSTVVDNVSDDGPAVTSSILFATNTTVAGNTGSPANLAAFEEATLQGVVVGDPIGGPNCSVAHVRASTHNVASDDSCELTGPTNLVDVGDLLLGPPRDNGGTPVGPVGNQLPALTRFPLAGSPVLDRVPIASCPDRRDQRQVRRPFGPGCDAGAIEAVFEPHPFTDVPRWVEDAVRWLNSDVNDPPLMVGVTPTRFRPEFSILRAQVVRMLYRLEGEPDPTAYDPHPFTDVPPWVEDAVRWAYGEGIVTGETPTRFAPGEPITRGQVVRMVYRIAGSPPVAGIDPPPFDDVPGWVADAVRWAANPDNPLPLVTGETPTQFNAERSITRGQVARMIWRLAITPAAWDDDVDPPRTVPFRPDGG
jgi:hypothetical protein